MPDGNKLKKLEEIGYCLTPGCGQCQHGRFAPGVEFGQCAMNVYEHAKHGERKLSVHRSGRCADGFQWNTVKRAQVVTSGFEQFEVV